MTIIFFYLRHFDGFLRLCSLHPKFLHFQRPTFCLLIDSLDLLFHDGDFIAERLHFSDLVHGLLISKGDGQSWLGVCLAQAREGQMGINDVLG
jgi:hypothetical protein